MAKKKDTPVRLDQLTEEEMKTGFDLICGGNEGDRK